MTTWVLWRCKMMYPLWDGQRMVLSPCNWSMYALPDDGPPPPHLDSHAEAGMEAVGEFEFEEAT